MKVAKFGGTSLADAKQIRKVCDIIAADPDRRIVVVSAPGKRHKQDTKVTDLLIGCADSFLSGGEADAALEAVAGRYAEIQQDMGLPQELSLQIRSDLSGRLIPANTANKARFYDMLKAAGEDNCARLVAMALNHRGIAAGYVSPLDAGLLLSDEFGNAQVLPQSYDNLSSLASYPGVVVFPGFFGYTISGELVTLPRGGSDITGAILAAAVKADVYENFTDMDSVLAADPGIVPDASPIDRLTYREMRELSYSGFSIFHDEALLPVFKAGIPVCVKNTNNPQAPGTWIVPAREYIPGRAVGIASDDGFCTLTVSKYLMNREIGFGRRLLQIIEEEGVPFEHVPSGIDNTSVIIRESLITGAIERKITERIERELEADLVTFERGLALIMIVGEGMRCAVGVAARATRALADAGISIEMLNQGASEISMMFGVKAVDMKKAVRALYHSFFPLPD